MNYENQHAELLEILRQLVAIPSFTDNVAMSQEVIAFAAHYLADFDMHIETFAQNGHPSLIATTRKTTHPKLFLQAHLDVVPGSLTQLEMVAENGRLYGRGVYDMKFAAACFLLAVKQLKDHLGDLDFGIMFTTDEESGGEDGVGYLTSLGYNADAVLLPDGGADWQVEVAARGSWSFRASATGTSSHSSRPWLGDNAIDKLLDFIQRVKNIIPTSQDGDSTLVVSRIAGGEADNQVPALASVTFNARYETNEQARGYRSKITEAASQTGVELEHVLSIEPRQLDTNARALQVWNQTVASVRAHGAEPGYTKSLGASDARYFGDTPVIVVSPGGGGAHSDREWISQGQLYEFYDCIVRYIEQFARVNHE